MHGLLLIPDRLKITISEAWIAKWTKIIDFAGSKEVNKNL